MTHAIARIGQDRYRTDMDIGHGRSLIGDEPAARGGGDAGPAPYDYLLASLASCTAITLRMYADRKEWPMESAEVRLYLHGQSETLRIERVLAVTGDLDEAQRARLLEVSGRTPVTLTLMHGLPIDTRWED
jgi:putative redox protein